MSRDSRLLHSRLHALTEHLAAYGDELDQAAGRVHAELQARRDQVPEHLPEPAALPAPEHDTPPVDH